MATVRLGDDLNARLKAAAAKRRPPVSVTVLVAEACEQMLAGPATPPPPAARASEPEPARSTLSRARRPTTRSSRQQGATPCSHPIGRRIAGTCLVCGAKVS